MLAFVALIALQNAPSLDDPGIAFSGYGFMFRVKVPHGWKIDKQSRSGTTLATLSPTLAKGEQMTIGYLPKTKSFDVNLVSFLRPPKGLYRPGQKLTAQTLSEVPTYTLVDAGTGKACQDRLAIMERYNVAIWMKITAKDAATFANAQPAFELLVRSFTFVTDRVK